MANKTFLITFKLPQLSASHYYHVVEITASGLGRAVDLGYKEVRKRKAVKGKRIDQAEISVKEVKPSEEDE